MIHASQSSASSLQSAETLPQDHPGEFFELGKYELDRLRIAGYDRVGVAMALLNSAGEILVLEHKGNAKLIDGTLGITSETVSFDSSSEQAEPIIKTIGRCLANEVNIDPASADIRTRLEAPFTLADLPSGNKGRLGRVLGINIALLLDDAAAMTAANVTDTPEAHRAFFVDQSYLLEHAPPELRPGTTDCLRSLGSVGLLEVSSLNDARLKFPDHDYHSPTVDIDLSVPAGNQ